MINRLVDEKSVCEELESVFQNTLSDDTIRELARKICGGAPAVNGKQKLVLFKKIFVILVMCEKISAISKFLAEGVSDDDLPLVKVPRPGKSRLVFDLGRRERPKLALHSFHDWGIFAERIFEEWQWTTQAPILHETQTKVSSTTLSRTKL
jgi:hypothetical protein